MNVVLDIGCGYGSLTNHLSQLGFQVTGIDSDVEMIRRGKSLFPELKEENLQIMDAVKISFQDGFFDAVNLRDCLHHLYQEPNINSIFLEIERVLQPNGLLVIFDPQPNVVLRFARILAKHQDEQCSEEEANNLLVSRG